MKILVKTKLLEGKYAECREYELFKQPVKIIYCQNPDYKNCSHKDCDYMYLTLGEQKKGRVTNTQKSKFVPYSYYKLYKFLFKPERKEPEPLNLFSEPNPTLNDKIQAMRKLHNI